MLLQYVVSIVMSPTNGMDLGDLGPDEEMAYIEYLGNELETLGGEVSAWNIDEILPEMQSMVSELAAMFDTVSLSTRPASVPDSYDPGSPDADGAADILRDAGVTLGPEIANTFNGDGEPDINQLVSDIDELDRLIGNAADRLQKASA